MHTKCLFQWQILTPFVKNSKALQIWNIISHDYFVVSSGLLNSFNNLINIISIIKEGPIDSNSPWVREMVYQDRSTCTIHVPSLNLKVQNTHYWLIFGEVREVFRMILLSTLYLYIIYIIYTFRELFHVHFLI